VLAATTAHDRTVPRKARQRFNEDESREEHAMHPGLSEAECRVAEFRYRELHAMAERERLAAYAAAVPSGRVGVMETMQRHVSAFMEQASHLLQSVRTQEATEHADAPSTLALSK